MYTLYTIGYNCKFLYEKMMGKNYKKNIYYPCSFPSIRLTLSTEAENPRYISIHDARVEGTRVWSIGNSGSIIWWNSQIERMSAILSCMSGDIWISICSGSSAQI